MPIILLFWLKELYYMQNKRKKYMLNVPHDAVSCFEKLTGLTISCYIYSPVFSRLSRWRNHKNDQCRIFKEKFAAECIHFDSFHTVENIWNFPDGCLKTCHANFSELVLPVIRDGKLLCLLLSPGFQFFRMRL